jgi:phenylalanyl-tRNA synthetase beta subunit
VAEDIVAEIDVIEEVARLHGYYILSDQLRPFASATCPIARTSILGLPHPGYARR